MGFRLGQVLRRFRRSDASKKSDLPGRFQRGRSAVASGADVEAAVLRPRVLGREVLHRAPDGETGETEELLGPTRSGHAVEAKVADKYGHAGLEYVDQILAQHFKVGDDAREAGEDEEEALKANAKKQILLADSNQDLLLKAELLVGEDWLGTIEMINGNIYRIGAFAGLVDISGGGRRTRCAGVARLLGCGIVFLIQLLGPLLIFISCTHGIGREEEKLYKWENWQVWNSASEVPLWYDWSPEHGIPTTKLLGLRFLEAFILNALFVSQDEHKTEEKIWDIFVFLKRNTPNYEVRGNLYLFMGSFIKNWLVIMCTLDAYMIFGSSRTPSEQILDFLALLFLFNLDDLGGDLGFVDEDDWPGLRIGWIHSEIVLAPSEEDEQNKGFKEKCSRKISIASYALSFWFCAFCSVMMPIMASLTPFTQISPAD